MMTVNLGRKLHHDPESRKYAAPPRKLDTRRNVRHAMNATHVDQFYTSGCVGGCATNGLNCAVAVLSRQKFNTVIHTSRSRRYLNNDDLLTNYSGATLYDPWPGQYPPTDEGSSAIGLMKYWKKYGVIGSYTWTFTFDQFLATLQHQPVLVGTAWYDDMMSTSVDGIVRSNASGNGGGHEYLATEIIWGKKLIGYEQSWGEHPPSFGVDGRFWMPMDLAEELIIHQEGDVAVPAFL